MIISYKGINNKGEKEKGIIEAQNIEDAKKRLKAKGIYYTSIKETKKPLSTTFSFTKKAKLTDLELATISRDLSIYLKAGISIVNALKLSKNQYETDKKISTFINSIITLLDEGKSFYQALENQSIIAIPQFYKQTIKVSENGGILQEVLNELSIYLKEQNRVNKQIAGAMFYPSFIATVSLFIIIFMMAYVVPKITSMFAQMHQELPKITQFVISIANFIKANYTTLFIIFIGIIITFKLLKKYNKKFKYFVDLTLLKTPLIGKIIEKSDLGRFAYISSVLLRSGIPFVQAINLSASTLANSVLEEKFIQASTKVVEGSKLSNSLLKEGYQIEKTFIQAIALGEETSQLELIFKNLSELYNEENRDKINILLSLLEPMVMLFVGVVIAIIIIAMLLPIFSINIS